MILSLNRMAGPSARLGRSQGGGVARRRLQRLGRAVCRWSGLPVFDGQADLRTGQFAAMVGGAGAVGPRN